MDKSGKQSDTLNLIQLEARILQQEHRLFRLLYNYFYLRHTFPENDERRDACVYAFYLRVAQAILPTAAATSICITSIAALVISVYTLTVLQKQNLTDARAALFTHSLAIQKTFFRIPRLAAVLL